MMRAHVLTVVQVILLPVCFIATYLWSVLLGHVEAGFPYISDTGTYPPESCLFGLLLDLYSSITAIIVYLRWKQVRTYYQADESRALHRANNISLVLGLVASFGVLLVANFQETNVIVVHLLGAFLAFVLGSVYSWVQTYLSYRTRLPGHRHWLRHARLLLSVVASACCVLVTVFAKISTDKLGESSPQGFKWHPSDKGFTEHVLSTTFEWALALMSAIFFATYSMEFRQFTVAMPVEFMVFSLEVEDREVVANGDKSGCENPGFSSDQATPSAIFHLSSETVGK